MNKKGFLVCCVMAGLLCSCNEQKSYSVQPLTVETETVGTTTDIESRSYVGTVEEEESVSVSFAGMGTLKRILVSEGECVRQGQLLAEMDDTQARNLLEGAQASFDQAEDAIGRYKQLHDKGSLPEAKWIEAQSKLEEMRSMLKTAQKNLDDCRLLAPMSGVVGKKQMSAGMTVLPSQPVVTLYKIKNVKVKVSVPEQEIADIDAHTPSQITVTATHQTVAGGRIEKGILADPLSHTYDIRIWVENPEQKILPGMVCKVSMSDERCTMSDAQMTVPVRCIQQSADGKHFVWVVDTDPKAHRQEITMGETVGNRIVVTSGLTEGTKVITAGYQKVSEGTEILPQ